MNILHYTIGLPPQRHGGSVQYAYDLMREQAKNHNVFALTCGDTLFRGRKSKFKNQGYSGNIQVLSLTNPLTPTLIYGASEPDLQHRNINIDKDNIRIFIQDNRIEVMHLHTLQGIHYDIVAFIKSLGVKIVYTTHDFHGICPKFNLIDSESRLCSCQSPERCAKCNFNQPSDKYLRLANSSLYHFLKSSGLLNIVRKKKENKHNKPDSLKLSNEEILSKIPAYQNLIDYYKDYFLLFDKLHFNSNQTRDVFTSFIPNVKGDVINVVTSAIKDKRKHVTPGNIIKFGFMGSLNEYKGFPMLREVIKELNSEGYKNLHLFVYEKGRVGVDEDCPNIEYMPPYTYGELSDILYHLDGTLVPSKWYETFSLVTLESLAHGRPVIVSDHVGAKDIVREYNPDFIFSSSQQLKDLLKSIMANPSIITDFSKKIMNAEWRFSMPAHCDDIIKFYNSVSK